MLLKAKGPHGGFACCFSDCSSGRQRFSTFDKKCAAVAVPSSYQRLLELRRPILGCGERECRVRGTYNELLHHSRMLWLGGVIPDKCWRC